MATAMIESAVIRALAPGLAALLALSALPLTASAQTALERNLPEQAAPAPGAISVGEQDYGEGDDTPLGVDVVGVHLIGRDEAVAATTPHGISLGNVPGIDAQSVTAVLSPLVGRPLTRALIVRMQGELAGLWRKAGYPFVSVTAPPQEITSGVLTLRVVEFHAGKIVTQGAAVERNLAGHVRIVPGSRIDAAALEEDLNWLNRNPFRRVEGVFAPGNETGASDFTLRVTQVRPWSVFASYANSGSEATGEDRWSTGGGVWIPELNDMTLSYRFTRSGTVGNDGSLTSLDASRPGYVSHAARIDLPTWSRQALSIAPSYVRTNELVGVTRFSFDNETFELPILYRSAVSNILPGHHWGDVYGGVEPKWVKRTTAFAGTELTEGDAALLNIVLGWAGTSSDAYGTTSIDARIKANPGGVVANSNDADWATFTGGRVTNATYVALGFDIARATRLPREFFWVSQLSGLVANQSLPDTERLGSSGYYAVRGYDSGEAAADTGLVWRNELRLPNFAPLANTGMGFADRLSPFVSVDVSHGYDFAAHDHTTLASTGLGLDYAIGTNVAVSLIGTVALADGDDDSNGNPRYTRSGDWTFNASVRFAY